MEIRITTQQVLKVLYFLAWIIFIGLCIEAGGFIFNTLLSFIFSHENRQHLWQQANLSALYGHDKGQFFVMGCYLVITSVLRAIMFWLIVKILHEKEPDMSRPFSPKIRRFISNMAFLSLGIGLFSFMGINYARWIAGQG